VRRWYAVATGGLGWSPKAFWNATISEFFMAVEGHNETRQSGSSPMTRAEFEDLEERYLNHG